MPGKSSEIKAKAQRWFRFYAESLDDPKVQRLPPHLFKTWVNLLSMACTSGGTIRRDDVAFKLRLSEHDAATQIDELIGFGLLDIQADKTIEPHNWKARQFISDTSNERVRKHRENKKKGACNVTCNENVAPPEQSRAETEITPKPPEGDSADVVQFAKPVMDWRTAFATSDDHDGVEVRNGHLVLVNGTRTHWLTEFGDDESALSNALREAHANVNVGSRKSLKVQVEATLARIVRDMTSRRKNYLAAAAAKAAPKPVKLSRW